jgi:CBS domain containing-hemolysin-like protein
MEIAFISSNKLHIELAKQKGSFGAKVVSSFIDKPSDFISAMLIGNNISLVIYGLMMAKVLNATVLSGINSGLTSLLLNTLISTIVVLLTAEFLPKALFNKYANPLLQFLGVPAKFFLIILSPLVWIFSNISKLILRILGRKIEHEDISFGRKDLDSYLQEHQAGQDDESQIDSEIQILRNALDFSKTKARECMVPRTEIIALEINDSIDKLHQMFVDTGLSKIVIYEEDIDQIVGFTHSFEMFKRPEEIRDILLPIAFIPESMHANDILDLFTRESKSIAVVFDEFGGTAGMVCLEDVIEELIGEIEDEHDAEEQLEKELEEDVYLLSARLEIDYLNEKYHWSLPISEEYETIGGLMSIILERIPEENEILEIDNFILKAEKVNSTYIEEIELTILKDDL